MKSVVRYTWINSRGMTPPTREPQNIDSTPVVMGSGLTSCSSIALGTIIVVVALVIMAALCVWSGGAL